MKKEKIKLPSIISILILTLIAVFMWLGSDVYRAIKQPVEITVPTSVSQPLDPRLNENTINQIESRSLLNDSDIPDNVVISASSGPNSKSTPIPSATPSPQPSSAPTP